MTEKELKKRNRRELLELLLVQTQRADRLEAELAEARKKLADRTLTQSEAGSIAEAALKLNGVYESAESAAAEYVESVRRLSESQQTRAEQLVAETERKCAAREAAAAQKLAEIQAQLREIYRQKQILDELFDEITVKNE